MTSIDTYEGTIEVSSHGESDDVMFLNNPVGPGYENDDPLAKRLDWMSGKRVTVRYWVADKMCAKEDAIASFLGSIDGDADVRFHVAYSELTGYLWTDEDLNIGGHDLIYELKSHAGKWLILEVES